MLRTTRLSIVQDILCTEATTHIGTTTSKEHKPSRRKQTRLIPLSTLKKHLHDDLVLSKRESVTEQQYPAEEKQREYLAEEKQHDDQATILPPKFTIISSNISASNKRIETIGNSKIVVNRKRSNEKHSSLVTAAHNNVPPLLMSPQCKSPTYRKTSSVEQFWENIGKDQVANEEAKRLGIGRKWDSTKADRIKSKEQLIEMILSAQNDVTQNKTNKNGCTQSAKRNSKLSLQDLKKEKIDEIRCHKAESYIKLMQSIPAVAYSKKNVVSNIDSLIQICCLHPMPQLRIEALRMLCVLCHSLDPVTLNRCIEADIGIVLVAASTVGDPLTSALKTSDPLYRWPHQHVRFMALGAILSLFWTLESVYRVSSQQSQKQFESIGALANSSLKLLVTQGALDVVLLYTFQVFSSGKTTSLQWIPSLECLQVNPHSFTKEECTMFNAMCLLSTQCMQLVISITLLNRLEQQQRKNENSPSCQIHLLPRTQTLIGQNIARSRTKVGGRIQTEDQLPILKCKHFRNVVNSGLGYWQQSKRLGPGTLDTQHKRLHDVRRQTVALQTSTLIQSRLRSASILASLESHNSKQRKLVSSNNLEKPSKLCAEYPDDRQGQIIIPIPMEQLDIVCQFNQREQYVSKTGMKSMLRQATMRKTTKVQQEPLKSETNTKESLEQQTCINNVENEEEDDWNDEEAMEAFEQHVKEESSFVLFSLIETIQVQDWILHTVVLAGLLNSSVSQGQANLEQKQRDAKLAKIRAIQEAKEKLRVERECSKMHLEDKLGHLLRIETNASKDRELRNMTLNDKQEVSRQIKRMKKAERRAYHLLLQEENRRRIRKRQSRLERMRLKEIEDKEAKRIEGLEEFERQERGKRKEQEERNKKFDQEAKAAANGNTMNDTIPPESNVVVEQQMEGVYPGYESNTQEGYYESYQDGTYADGYYQEGTYNSEYGHYQEGAYNSESGHYQEGAYNSEYGNYTTDAAWQIVYDEQGHPYNYNNVTGEWYYDDPNSTGY